MLKPEEIKPATRTLAVRKFEIGQLVYTKITGFPPWPSCIIDIKEKNGVDEAEVRYFGWNSDKSYVPFQKLTPITAEKAILNKYYGKQKRFTRAVDQMKNVLKNINKS